MAFVPKSPLGRPPVKERSLRCWGPGEGVHYRLHWDDGHESTFFLSGGSITITRKAKKAQVP
jgi:hypothetical protein